ncbi:MAG: GTPase Era [Candidatus Caccovivens sp.]
MKCGYVAVLGQPNAGKSSLVNFFVGEEVAVVSHRRQTTRNSILGIKTGKDYQIIFVDTPGVHHSKNNLDKFMMKNVRSAIASADVALYLFDGSVGLQEEEKEYIESLRQKCENVILVQTKADKKQKFDGGVDANIISVKSGEGTEELLKKIVNLLPEGESIFDEELYTDKSVKFLLAEKVRGILLEKLDNEIPHGVAVVVTRFDEDELSAYVDLEIICEKEQHKGIIIGRGGSTLKEVGSQARKYLEELIDKKCTIKIFVKVDKDWRDRNVNPYI